MSGIFPHISMRVPYTNLDPRWSIGSPDDTCGAEWWTNLTVLL